MTNVDISSIFDYYIDQVNISFIIYIKFLLNIYNQKNNIF